jgi:YhcH/YjgK/YiaL family protein
VIAADLSLWRNYFTGPTWTTAFEFLEKLPADSPDNDGLVPIVGDELLYRVMSYPTRGMEGTTVEAHETYVDIQMSLEGTEAIDWFVLDGLEVNSPYNSEKDYALYERPAQPTGTVVNRPRYFSVFFPEDGHTAQKSAAGVSENVRKVVIKVKLSCVRPL